MKTPFTGPERPVAQDASDQMQAKDTELKTKVDEVKGNKVESSVAIEKETDEGNTKSEIKDDERNTISKNGSLLPGKVFVLNGVKYETDANGNISCVERIKTPRLPENNGQWTGERGNSNWIPDRDYVPPEKSKNPDKPFSNPQKLPWKDILAKFGISGIPFKNGFPVFDAISKASIKIEGFETGKSDAKARNFARADRKLAELRGCTPDDVKKWRETNNFTWHENEDKTTMQKVPNEIHANIPHNGGRSQE